jgi:hypothetical protein
MGDNFLLLVSTDGGVCRILKDFARFQLEAILPRKMKCESQKCAVSVWSPNVVRVVMARPVGIILNHMRAPSHQLRGLGCHV